MRSPVPGDCQRGEAGQGLRRGRPRLIAYAAGQRFDRVGRPARIAAGPELSCFTPMSDDEAITKEIRAAGRLTLKGEVKHPHESGAAFEVVSRLPGVGGITNEIKVITAGIDG